MNKCACKLFRHSKIFSPTLSPTVEKPQNGVSHLTDFSKLKFNRTFIDAFGRLECMLTFMMFGAILVVIKVGQVKV